MSLRSRRLARSQSMTPACCGHCEPSASAPAFAGGDYRVFRRKGSGRRSSKISRAVFEALETRQLMSVTIPVTTAADSGSGSLRAAVAQANNDGNDTITFSPSLSGQTIMLSSGDLELEKSVTIVGLGANHLTINGNSASNIFTVDSGVTATIAGLTLSGGYNMGGNGGAIDNEGWLNIDACAFTGNIANDGGKGGGAIYNDDMLVVTDSTFSGNQAVGSVGGGALYNDGMASIFDSTLASNTTPDDGGAVENSTDSLELVNCTLAYNTAVSGNGGGIANESGASVTLYNTIVAENKGDGVSNDIFGYVEAKSAYNLVGTGAGLTGISNANGNRIGANPMLSPLGYHGGPTETLEPYSDSPAINNGDATDAVGPDSQPLVTDQRGYLRQVNYNVDIGAVETNSEAAPASLVVNTTQDNISYTPGSTSLSLRQAVGFANFQNGGATITFCTTVFTGATSPAIDVVNGPIDFTNPTGTVTVQGLGQSLVTVSGAENGQNNIFYVNPVASLSLSQLTLTGADNPSNYGGAIDVDGTLTVNGVAFTNNIGGSGGAIYDNGTVAINDGLFTGNAATIAGGAIYISGGSLSDADSTPFNDTDSTYTDNGESGSILTASGGAIFIASPATLDGDDFSGNHAVNGAGIYNENNVTINGGEMSNDVAAFLGGGIFTNGNFTINGTVLTGERAVDGGGIFNEGGGNNYTLTSVTINTSCATASSGGIP
ncbi:MAG: choice-of-anchor Q domain-containing protein, partial [Tepidisphaeraceae bacterium]